MLRIAGPFTPLLRALERACSVRAVSAGVLAAMIVATTVAMAQPAAAQVPGPKSVATVAKKQLDAVVNISTAQKVKSARRGALPSVPKGSPFEDLFEDFFD